MSRPESDRTALIRAAVFARSTVPSLVVDHSARVLDVNDAYVEMTRRSRAELIGRSTIEFVNAVDVPAVISGLDQLRSGVPAVRHRRRHQRGDDTWIAIEVVTSFLPDPDGGEDLILVQTVAQGPDVAAIDPTDELMTRQLFRPAGDEACIHDALGQVAFTSEKLDALLGRPDGWILGRTLTDPELATVHPDGSPIAAVDDPVVRAIAEKREVVETIGVLDADGRRIWLSVAAGAVQRATLPARSSLRDITELVEAQNEARRLAALVEERLTYQNEHDDLTGIAARRVVLRHVDAAIEAGESVSVVFVDLDGFKAVNDTLGHVVGDEVLVEVAEILRSVAGDSIVVGRAGGDEFVAVTSSEEAADAYAAEIRRRAATRDGLVCREGRRVGASVGIAHSRTGDTSTSLLARADRVMYDAKRSRR